MALGLVGSELILRRLSPVRLGFELRDGKFVQPKEFEPDLSRNSLGFHDVEPGEKKPGVRRVLLLGDSYVGAAFVSTEQTVGRRIQHHLDAAAPGAYQVISIGRSGWGQSDQLDHLRRLGKQLQPDLVLTLALTFNDVSDNYPPLKRDVHGQRQGMRKRRPGIWEFPVDAAPCLWLPWSRLNQLISVRLHESRPDASLDAVPLPYFVYKTPPDAEWEAAWRRTAELIQQTRDEARALDARYAVATASTPHGIWGAAAGLQRLMRAYPGMREVATWDLDRPDQRLAEICRGLEVPFERLEPIFREQTAAGRRLHWTYNGHWNVEGNDFAGRLLADFVRRVDPAGMNRSAADESSGAPTSSR